jgi:type I site-specific restriction endonuclease
MTPAYTPEQEARIEIDRQLEAAGWQVQDYQRMNLHAQRGVAVREFPLRPTGARQGARGGRSARPAVALWAGVANSVR